MKYIIVFSFFFNLSFISSQNFRLDDFYKSDPILSNKVDSIFDLLNDTTRIGQMIVPAIGRLGKTRDHVYDLANKGWIGGILLLNGTFIVSGRIFNSGIGLKYPVNISFELSNTLPFRSSETVSIANKPRNPFFKGQLVFINLNDDFKIT